LEYNSTTQLLVDTQDLGIKKLLWPCKQIYLGSLIILVNDASTFPKRETNTHLIDGISGLLTRCNVVRIILFADKTMNVIHINNLLGKWCYFKTQFIYIKCIEELLSKTHPIWELEKGEPSPYCTHD
jgi:hypothetical protein